jgi:hypothetical protein
MTPAAIGNLAGVTKRINRIINKNNSLAVKERKQPKKVVSKR